jgi:hypothetical protein
MVLAPEDNKGPAGESRAFAFVVSLSLGANSLGGYRCVIAWCDGDG